MGSLCCERPSKIKAKVVVLWVCLYIVGVQVFVESGTRLKRDAGLALCVSYNNISTVRILVVSMSMRICRFLCQVSCMLYLMGVRIL